MLPCKPEHFDTIHEIINDAAIAYRDVIPADRWHDPYMSRDELSAEIEAGVRFHAADRDGRIVAVMGIQDVLDVTLIRHAYTRTSDQGKGLGKQLLRALCERTTRPILVGTWADARWAIDFYRNNGFAMTTEAEKDVLLRKYWNIPERQIATSVVLSRASAALLL